MPSPDAWTLQLYTKWQRPKENNLRSWWPERSYLALLTVGDDPNSLGTTCELTKPWADTWVQIRKATGG